MIQFSRLQLQTLTIQALNIRICPAV